MLGNDHVEKPSGGRFRIVFVFHGGHQVPVTHTPPFLILDNLVFQILLALLILLQDLISHSYLIDADRSSPCWCLVARCRLRSVTRSVIPHSARRRLIIKRRIRIILPSVSAAVEGIACCLLPVLLVHGLPDLLLWVLTQVTRSSILVIPCSWHFLLLSVV